MESKSLTKCKRIVLLETDSVIVSSSFDLIAENLKSFIKVYDIEEDKQLLRQLFSTSKTVERNLADIAGTPALKARLDFRTADLLQQGKCIVYNKAIKTFEEGIICQDYWKKWWTGKRFTTWRHVSIMDIRTGAY
jgi:hypothetical protein